MNPSSQPFRILKVRKVFGMLLQHLAWKKENVPWNQSKSKALVPTGFFSNASKKELPSYSQIRKNLQSLRGSINKTINIALIGKHFSENFIKDLEKVLRDTQIPFTIKNLKSSEWNSNFSEKNYDITHLPMQPSFYDPDGMFISLQNYFPDELQFLFKRMTKFRNSTKKVERIQGYIKGLRDIEDTWILVPTYRKYAPYLASEKIQIPETMFRNEFETWKISKSK